MPTMTYNFRVVPEIAIAVAIAMLVPVLQALMSISGFADLTPEFWDGVLAGALKAGIGVLLALITGGGFQTPGVPGPPPEQPKEEPPTLAAG